MSSPGTVKFFNNVKGFGFISPSDGSEDVFVHANDVTDQQVLMEGDEVGASFWGVAERFDWFPIVFQMESFRVLEHFRSFSRVFWPAGAHGARRGRRREHGLLIPCDMRDSEQTITGGERWHSESF